jgi:hypothetical protein
MSIEVLRGARSCFPDLTLDEYVQTALLYGLRQIGYGLLPVARLRVLAWLHALYQLHLGDSVKQAPTPAS